MATGFFGLGTITGIVLSPWVVEIEEFDEEGDDLRNNAALKVYLESIPPDEIAPALYASMYNNAINTVPALDLKAAQVLLETYSGRAVGVKTIAHSCCLPSNFPCEDVRVAGEYNYFGEREKNWIFFYIFDGHAGPRTAHVLPDFLPSLVGDRLWKSGCMGRGHVPNDDSAIQAIKGAFTTVDDELLKAAKKMAEDDRVDMSFKNMATAPVLSGSCALMALFDPVHSVLRVANTGDSRAVLGRWDVASGRYVAKPMSVDQTGFNQDEVQRLRREHPGEDPVDPKTGRVHGLAVTRAFGDARWKWPNEFNAYVHEKLFGPPPRPNGVIKTPPYLTAEPEVTETQVQTGSKPDFLIIASDGLWDNMSSEDAVTCVQMWLDKYQPSDGHIEDDKSALIERLSKPPFDKQGPGSSFAYDTTEDNETYYDESERCMKWRVSPKHFVVEDENAGVHLIKNALGGSRRNLFCGIVGVVPPLSRVVRDDISVQVIFFGQDLSNKELTFKSGRPAYNADGKRTKHAD